MSVALLPPLNGDVRRRPRVSVVMPTYRRADVIAETLRTVVAQTFDDVEILICADGTDPAAAERVRDVGDLRIRYSETGQRMGMPHILNRLIGETTGEYVLTLHDHDVFDRELIARMVAALDAHPTALFVHTALQQIDQTGAVGRRFIGNWAPLTNGREWLTFMLSRFDCPVCAMSMVRRRAYEMYGLYDADYGFISDVEMWMRLSTVGDVAYVNEPLMGCRVRDEGHEYRAVDWMLTDTLIRMHRRYLEASHRNSVSERLRFAARADVFRTVQLLASLKRSRFDARARAEARRYLTDRGGPLSRTLAWAAWPRRRKWTGDGARGAI